MNELCEHIVSAFEYVHINFSEINVSDTLEEQFDAILRPVFTDPTSCKMISDSLDQLGDFSEHVLIPLIEQYVSADTAARVKFLIEDLLTSIERYRDYHLKQISQSKVKSPNSSGIPGIRGTRLGGRITNQYRHALKETPKNKYQSKTLSYNVIDVNSGNQLHKLVVTQNGRICGIVWDNERKRIVERTDMVMPTIKRAGQVLIKIAAVGLNNYDFSKFEHQPAARHQLANLKASLSTNFASIRNTLRVKKASSQIVHGSSDVNRAASYTGIGVEFVGTVKDIGWAKGDYVHMLPVAREQKVFGVLTSTTNTNFKFNSALSEYVVVDSDNVVKIPSGMSDVFAASLAVDGATVCRALATTSITKYSKIVVIGALTNAGLLLLQLLTSDLELPPDNLICFCRTGGTAVQSSHVLAGQATSNKQGIDEVAVLTDEFNIPAENIYDIGMLKMTPSEGQSSSEKVAVVTVGDSSLFPDILDRSVDEIFDCSETGKNDGYSVTLSEKLKEDGQFISLDSSKVIWEKNISGESWQRELLFLISKFKQKKFDVISRMISHSAFGEPMSFSREDVNSGIELLEANSACGKLVVQVTDKDIDLMKRKGSSGSINNI